MSIRNINKMVDSIIKKDFERATRVLTEYLLDQTHRLILKENLSSNEDDYIPDVTSKCTDSSCEVTVIFNENVSEEFIQKVYEHPSVTALEQTVGGVVDDELLGPTTHRYRCRFDDLDDPQMFAQQYEKVITDAAYEVLDSLGAELSDDYDDYYPERETYTNDEADRAEAKWWDERNSIR